MRRLLTTTTALLGLAASAAVPLLAIAPADAAETIVIKPASLPRGADVKGAHLDGTTIVDGDVSVKVKRPNVKLYGTWEGDYIAATGNSAWDKVKLVRITPTGTVEVLREFIDPFTAVLDAENDQIAYSYGGNTQKPTLAAYDLGLDKEVSVRGFVAMPQLLDFGGGVMVASFGPPKAKTITWNTVTNEVEKKAAKQGNYASVANNLLGYFTKDPQLGGCQVLGHLSDPTDTSWTSCDERIDAVSPDGKRLATIPLQTDGLGSRDVVLRQANGRLLAHYTVGFFFGTVWFETNTNLLMDANAKTKAATVRCKVAACNRATDVRPTPDI